MAPVPAQFDRGPLANTGFRSKNCFSSVIVNYDNYLVVAGWDFI